MRIRPCLAAVALAWAISACDVSSERPPDAGPCGSYDASRDMDAILDYCSKIAQTGCPATQRCTLRWISIDPIESVNDCTADGTKILGEPCAVDPDSGFDDCVAGTICYSEPGDVRRCSTLCWAAGGVDTCEVGSCLVVQGFFGESEGICVE